MEKKPKNYLRNTSYTLGAYDKISVLTDPSGTSLGGS